jgi:hypothetical protein
MHLNESPKKMPKPLERQPWNIAELEQFFSTAKLPKSTKLSFGRVVDVPKFVERHLNHIKHNKQKPSFRPYLERLEVLKIVLKNEL